MHNILNIEVVDTAYNYQVEDEIRAFDCGEN